MPIRLATADDASLVASLRLDFLAEEWDVERSSFDEGFVAQTVAFIEKRAFGGTLPSWIAEDDLGRTIGVVSMILNEMQPRPRDPRTLEGYIINMYVVPTQRRGGVGRTLLDACLSWAEDNGVRRVTLVATDDGRRMYEQRGFSINPSFMERRVEPS